MSATKKAPTYDRVREEIERHGGSAVKQDKSALTAWKEAMGADFDHRATSLLVEEQAFESALDAHVAEMRGRDGSPAPKSSRSQRKSRLRRIRRLALPLAEADGEKWDTLPGAIRSCRIRMGLTQNAMCKRWGAAFVSWEREKATPISKATPRLEEFAKAAGVSPEVLTGFVVPARRRNQNKTQGKAAERYSLENSGYLFPGSARDPNNNRAPKVPLPDDCPLKKEMEDFIEYKTADQPPRNLARSTNGGWTFNASGECSSKDINASRLNLFFGFVHNILGVPLEKLTLAMAGDYVLLRKYDDFLKRRGSRQGAGRTMPDICLGFIRPKSDRGRGNAEGFVRQQRWIYGPRIYGDGGYLECGPVRSLYAETFGFPDDGRSGRDVLLAMMCARHDMDDVDKLRESLGDDDRTIFRDWCDYNFEKILDFQRNFERNATKEVGSKELVDQIVNASPERRERPIRVARDLILHILSERDRYAAGRATDTHDYDLALVAFLASIPLREFTLRNLRIHPDLVDPVSRENLPANYTPSFLFVEGGYLLSEHRDYFKNRDGLKKRDILYFRMPVADWSVPFLRDYIDNVRPKMRAAQAGSPYLFPPLSRDRTEPAHRGTLAGRIREHTTRLFGVTMGVHWFRHLVATDILATHPEALHFVADVLQDDLETVRALYDASRPADAGRFAHRHQETVMGQLFTADSWS